MLIFLFYFLLFKEFDLNLLFLIPYFLQFLILRNILLFEFVFSKIFFFVFIRNAFILITFEVLKFDKTKDFKEKHSENISSIYLILLVLKLDLFKFSKEEQL